MTAGGGPRYGRRTAFQFYVAPPASARILTAQQPLAHSEDSMKLIPISAICPQCGSGDVFYSCNPTCCYNHVCNKCYTTFELETTRVGEVGENFDIPPDPDSGAPTASC